MESKEDILSVREITNRDVELITNYWTTASSDLLLGMGVDLTKMPSRDQWISLLNEQISLPYKEKKSYCIIWQLDNVAIGHSNINKIIYGEEAFMHLHLWHSVERRKGVGTQLVRMTLPYFFENFKLKKLFCEPYALNRAPNKTLHKAGFKFVKDYVTTPGWINFEQKVNLWELSRKEFNSMNS
jgi:RimJ/RimL family protein N-acetyltransferase